MDAFVRRPTGASAVRPDATVLALGGASWPRLGSDGGWVETLAARASRYRRCGRPIAASRWPGPRSSAIASKATAQGRRAVVRRPRARGEAVDHTRGHRGRRRLCALGRLREASSRRGQAPCSRAAARSRHSDLGRPAVDAAGQAVLSTGCARRRIFRRSASGCCRKRRSRGRTIVRRCRPQALPIDQCRAGRT